ncbi:MAG: ABC transporter permease [Flavobacteriales bacterium]|nr:ABC transporter permease [Flavobacteriales bacterium]
MLLKLAWRNIWRNKRRTAITIASIFFAVFFAVFMRSMQLGIYAQMIDSVVRFYTGHIQVHGKGYWDDQTMDNAFSLEEESLSEITKNQHITLAARRLEGFALSSYGETTKGVLLLGVDPKVEDELMGLSAKLTAGKLFGKDDSAVIIGEKLAKFYDITIGDTMVFISQGYHGVSAAAKYPVVGTVKFAAAILNEKAVLFPLKEAQYFYGAENMATSIAVIIDNPNRLSSVKKQIIAALDTTRFEVLDWQEAMPELVQAIQADSAGGQIMLFILYMVVSFGIFGTMLMLMQERRYEFGVLLSIGMSRFKIWGVVFFVALITTIMGAILGLIGVFPLIYYLHDHPYQLTGKAAQAMAQEGWDPVLPSSLDPSIALTHMLIVIGVSMAITLYAAWVIGRMRPVDARRS